MHRNRHIFGLVSKFWSTSPARGWANMTRRNLWLYSTSSLGRSALDQFHCAMAHNEHIMNKEMPSHIPTPKCNQRVGNSYCNLKFCQVFMWCTFDHMFFHYYSEFTCRYNSRIPRGRVRSSTKTTRHCCSNGVWCVPIADDAAVHCVF